MITETTGLGNIKNLKLSNCKDGKFVIEADFELTDQHEHGPYVKTTLYTMGKDETLEFAIQHLIQSTVGAILEYHNEQFESKKDEDPCTFKSI